MKLEKRMQTFSRLMATLLLTWSAAAFAKDVTISLGHVAPPPSIYHIASTYFAERVSTNTGGSVTVEVFPGAQLGGDRDLLEGVQLGTVEAGYISLAIFEGLSPALTGFQMPFLIDSYATAKAAMTSDTAFEALAEFEEFGIKGLAIIENGMRVPGNNKRPIRTPSDFKGLAWRAPEAALHLKMFEMMGANVTPMPFPEVYTALQTGVIDGQDQFLQTWIGMKAHEIAKHMSQINMYTWPAVIAINKALFDALSTEQQNGVMQAAAEATDYTFAMLDDMDAKMLAIVEGAGVSVEKDVDPKPFMEILSPLYDEYSAQSPVVAKTIALIEAARQ